MEQMVNWQKRFEEKIQHEPNTGCWLFDGSLNGRGYAQFSIKNKPHKAHRIAYQLWVGPIPDEMHVLHKCDVRICVNPDHLWVGTNRDNMDDKIEKNRHQIGSDCPWAKLAENDVFAILEDKRIYKEIASDYGVSVSAIADIKTGRNWRHVYEQWSAA